MIDETQRFIFQLLDRIVEPTRMCVVNRYGSGSRAAQELPERQLRGLRHDVPQGNVDGRLRHGRGARTSDPMGLAEIELLPDLTHIARVAADEIFAKE